VDVVISYWRFIRNWSWHEGPKRDDVLEFALAEPEGNMLRYQVRQRRNILDRWAKHVEGWVSAAATRPRLVVVAYEQLDRNYAGTIRNLEPVFGRRPLDLTRPPRDINVIKAVPGNLGEPDRRKLRELALAEVGETMRALGYA
jgi:hypothetical protein